MKKIIALLLVCVFSLLFTASIAEDAQELTFQEIQWLSAPKETIDKLVEIGLLDKKKTAEYMTQIKEINKAKGTIIDSKIYCDEKNPLSYSLSKSGKQPVAKNLQRITIDPNHILKTIAGQDVGFIRFLFTLEPDNPKLVECWVSLFGGTAADDEAVYSTLLAAFGECSKENNLGERIWFGKNNTIIIQSGTFIVFATLDGLNYANSIYVLQSTKEDTGF